MRRQRKSMDVAHFLSNLPSSYDPIRSQILGARDLPSLSEVLVMYGKHLCQIPVLPPSIFLIDLH